jgi:hypothetical protein
MKAVGLRLTRADVPLFRSIVLGEGFNAQGNVEDLLPEHGTEISHEAVRLSWNQSGPMVAARRRRWQIDQMRNHSHWPSRLQGTVGKINRKACRMTRNPV